MAIPDESDILRDKHNKSFSSWFKNEFLKGTDVEPCPELFDEYRASLRPFLRLHGIEHMLEVADSDRTRLTRNSTSISIFRSLFLRP